MFWNKVKETVAPDTEKQDLKSKIALLEGKLKWYEEYNKVLEDSARSAPIGIDFQKLNVFSVERNINQDKLPFTIVGYLIETPYKDDSGMVRYTKQVKEWFYHCDDERHQQLVKEFEEHKINLAKRPF